MESAKKQSPISSKRPWHFCVLEIHQIFLKLCFATHCNKTNLWSLSGSTNISQVLSSNLLAGSPKIASRLYQFWPKNQTIRIFVMIHDFPKYSQSFTLQPPKYLCREVPIAGFIGFTRINGFLVFLHSCGFYIKNTNFGPKIWALNLKHAFEWKYLQSKCVILSLWQFNVLGLLHS